MVTIERVSPTHAKLRATQEEWSQLRVLIQHSIEIYDDTDLDYMICGLAETRFRRLELLGDALAIPERDQEPYHRDALRILLTVVGEWDMRADLPMGAEAAEELSRSLSSQWEEEFFNTP